MAKELKHIDITHRPDLLQIVHELHNNEPVVLQEESQDVAIVRPLKRPRQARAPRGKILTEDDSLWRLVGSATSAPPTDATKKHEYLAEALAPRQV
ncbi:MAG: hypothetical protein Q7R39_18530 [Dehalococcoidia bacterium]|nr:hypothetical protein [Dehalococcoidia bacterium]